MHTNRRWLWLFMILLLAGTNFPLLQIIQAQGSTTILSVSIPGDYREVLGTRLLGEFEANHPGLKINVIDESERKVYGRRLKACRDLYQFVLESREKS